MSSATDAILAFINAFFDISYRLTKPLNRYARIISTTREPAFWLFLSLIPFVFIIRDWILQSGSIRLSLLTVAFNDYAYLFIAISTFLLPILVNLIFGDLPLGVLRVILMSMPRRTRVFDKSDPSAATDFETPLATIVKLNPRDLLAFYSERTSDVTKKIYNRAGVYLLVGVVISFTGLGIFYIRTSQTSFDYKLEIESQTAEGKTLREESSVKDVLSRILVLLPGFGILFLSNLLLFSFLDNIALQWNNLDISTRFDEVEKRV